jgi:deoxycytidylate deaminase
MDCARAVISSGITEVVIHRQGQEAFIHSRGGTDDVWADSHGVVWSALEEAGIKVRWFEEPLALIEGYFSGKVYKFDENGNGKATDNEPQT